MKRTIAAIAIAGALTMNAPAPAAAQETNTVATAIASLIALGVLAMAIDDHAPIETSGLSIRPDPNRSVVWDRNIGQVQRQPGSLGRLGSQIERDFRTNRLPARCVRQISTNRGVRKALSGPCLRRTYARSFDLPTNCARRVWTDRGTRTFYGARCLERAGYRIEARRGD